MADIVRVTGAATSAGSFRSDNPALLTTYNFAVSLVFRLPIRLSPTVIRDEVLFSNVSGILGGSGITILYRPDLGTLGVSLFQSSFAVFPFTVFELGGIHHVVVTGSSASGASMYVDGVSRKSWVVSEFSPLPPVLSAVSLGGSYGTSVSFSGEILSCRLFNCLLSSTQISSLWNDGHPEQYAIPDELLSFEVSNNVNWLPSDSPISLYGSVVDDGTNWVFNPRSGEGQVQFWATGSFRGIPIGATVCIEFNTVDASSTYFKIHAATQSGGFPDSTGRLNVTCAGNPDSSFYRVALVCPASASGDIAPKIVKSSVRVTTVPGVSISTTSPAGWSIAQGAGDSFNLSAGLRGVLLTVSSVSSSTRFPTIRIPLNFPTTPGCFYRACAVLRVESGSVSFWVCGLSNRTNALSYPSPDTTVNAGSLIFAFSEASVSSAANSPYLEVVFNSTTYKSPFSVSVVSLYVERVGCVANWVPSGLGYGNLLSTFAQKFAVPVNVVGSSSVSIVSQSVGTSLGFPTLLRGRRITISGHFQGIGLVADLVHISLAVIFSDSTTKYFSAQSASPYADGITHVSSTFTVDAAGISLAWVYCGVQKGGSYAAVTGVCNLLHPKLELSSQASAFNTTLSDGAVWADETRPGVDLTSVFTPSLLSDTFTGVVKTWPDLSSVSAYTGPSSNFADYVRFPSGQSFYSGALPVVVGTNNFSIELLIKVDDAIPPTSGSPAFRIGLGDLSSPGHFSIFRDESSPSDWLVWMEGPVSSPTLGSNATRFTPSPLPSGFFHFIVVRRGTSVQVFANGQSFAPKSQDRVIPLNSSLLVFGRSFVYGLRVYNTAMSVSDAIEVSGEEFIRDSVPDPALLYRWVTWPTAHSNSSQNSWADNVTGTSTLTSNIPASNGFSGAFVRFDRLTDLSVFSYYWMVFLIGGSFVPLGIDIEYRSDGVVKWGVADLVFDCPSAPSTAAKLHLFTTSTNTCSVFSTGTFLEIRTISVVPQGCFLECLPRTATPTLWRNSAGLGSGIPIYSSSYPSVVVPGSIHGDAPVWVDSDPNFSGSDRVTSFTISGSSVSTPVTINPSQNKDVITRRLDVWQSSSGSSAAGASFMVYASMVTLLNGVRVSSEDVTPSLSPVGSLPSGWSISGNVITSPNLGTTVVPTVTYAYTTPSYGGLSSADLTFFQNPNTESVQSVSLSGVPSAGTLTALPASGAQVTWALSATYSYSSGATRTAAVSPASVTWSLPATVGFTQSQNVTSVADRGTTVGAARSATLTASFSGKSASGSMTQVANAQTLTSVTVVGTPASGTLVALPASGTTVSWAATANFSYTSGGVSQSAIAASAVEWQLSGTGFTQASNVTTVANRGTVVGSARLGEMEGAYGGFTAKGSMTQVANAQILTSLAVTAPAGDIPAAGGSKPLTSSASYTYTSGATNSATVAAAYSGSASGFTLSGASVVADNRTTVVGSYRSVTVTGTFTSGSVTKQGNVVVGQAANSATYNTPVVSTFSYADIQASGSTVTPSVAYSQSVSYTSGSATSVTTGASLAYSGAGVNATTGAVSAPSLGTTAKSRTVIATASLAVTLNGYSSTTAQSQVYQEANVATYSAWNPFNVTWSSYADLAAAGGSVQWTAPDAEYTVSYTSGAVVSKSQPLDVYFDAPVAGFSLDIPNRRVTATNNTTTLRRSVTVVFYADAPGPGSNLESTVIHQAAGVKAYGTPEIINDFRGFPLAASGGEGHSYSYVNRPYTWNGVSASGGVETGVPTYSIQGPGFAIGPGSGAITATISAPYNPNATSRSFQVTLTYPGATTTTYQSYQVAGFLALSEPSLTFTSEGGVMENVITTSFPADKLAVSLAQPEDWVTLTYTPATLTVRVVVEANTGGERTVDVVVTGS